MKSPKELRKLIRNSKIQTQTGGLAPKFVQTNLVILPKENAFDFLLFCNRNPKPCPIIEVLEEGKFEAITSAPESDIRFDVPKYRIYEKGKLVNEPTSIEKYWKKDFVSFLLGCSFTFEAALIDAEINVRHLQENKTVPMFITSIKTIESGIFSGPLVVTMRPIKKSQIVKTIQITSRFPNVHGSPIHIGNPDEIGIKDILKPDFGDPVTINTNEVPVFWACGITPQLAALNSKPPLMITHSPGHMFITDIKNETISVL
ncbi:MAG: putative hydro-lyase [SAR202 cluster bacterium]|nr:putative hydro-lyase [SAR202 cluster bacterium]|tara:strand:- start:31219 stop:31995 length:777 start_codon:yes stop_codon:yes gene_type:complete